MILGENVSIMNSNHLASDSCNRRLIIFSCAANTIVLIIAYSFSFYLYILNDNKIKTIELLKKDKFVSVEGYLFFPISVLAVLTIYMYIMAIFWNNFLYRFNRRYDILSQRHPEYADVNRSKVITRIIWGSIIFGLFSASISFFHAYNLYTLIR